MTEQQYPFKTVTAAIVHAFNDERHGSARPAMARLADKRLGEPGAFAGADGGAEKATAADMLTKGMTRLHLAALRARYAPRCRACPACESKVARLDWLAAVREVSDAVGSEPEAAAIKPEVRFALVRRHFEGGEMKLQATANELGVSISTVTKANSLVMPFLRGAKKGKGDDAPMQGIEQAAYERAEEILRAGGFVP